MSFLTMKQKVLSRSRQSGTWATGVVADYLNECQNELAKMPVDWKVLEKQSTTSTVAAQRNYTLPSDYARTLALNLESGTSTLKRLVEYPWDTIRMEMNSDAETNDEPSKYCIHYQQLYLSPIPDAVYTLRMDYIYVPTDMSADGDTTPFPERLLMQYAMAHLKRDLGRYDEYQTEFAEYNRALDLFMQQQDREPDRMDGFEIGLSGVAPYWKESW